jgi:hypothetical protein
MSHSRQNDERCSDRWGRGWFRAAARECHRHRLGALAAADVAANGGVLDEARVNRLRYLEGTPKGSTRWIDTGWAIAMVVGMNAQQVG